jgi:hypothetical protein
MYRTKRVLFLNNSEINNLYKILFISLSIYNLNQTSQVDAFAMRIPPEPPGKYVYSGRFQPFPIRIKKEPSGNIHGRWKQFSRRIYPYRNQETSHPFSLSGNKRNLTVSSRIITGTSSDPARTDRKQQRKASQVTGTSSDPAGTDRKQQRKASQVTGIQTVIRKNPSRNPKRNSIEILTEIHQKSLPKFY